MFSREMEVLRTVGMTKDTYINGKQHFAWQLAWNHPNPNKPPNPQKKACSNYPWLNGRKIYINIVAIYNATSGNLCQERVNEEGGVIEKKKKKCKILGARSQSRTNRFCSYISLFAYLSHFVFFALVLSSPLVPFALGISSDLFDLHLTALTKFFFRYL